MDGASKASNNLFVKEQLFLPTADIDVTLVVYPKIYKCINLTTIIKLRLFRVIVRVSNSTLESKSSREPKAKAELTNNEKEVKVRLSCRR